MHIRWIFFYFFLCSFFLFLFFRQTDHLSFGGEGGTGHISVRLLQTDFAEELKGEKSAVLWHQGLPTGKKE
jgi:hypothetical protein